MLEQNEGEKQMSELLDLLKPKGKPDLSKMQEVTLEVPVKNLSLIDTNNLNECLTKVQTIITEAHSILEHNYSDLDQKQHSLTEIQQIYEESTRKIDRLHEQFSKIDQVIELLLTNLPLEQSVLKKLDKLPELNR